MCVSIILIFILHIYYIFYHEKIASYKKVSYIGPEQNGLGMGDVFRLIGDVDSLI